MDNKKYSFLLVLMIPISIGLLLYGLFAYNATGNKKNNGLNDDKDEQKYLKINSNEVQDLISFLVVDGENIYETNGSLYADYFYKNDVLDISNIKGSDKLAIALNSLLANKKIDYKNIDINELKEEYYKIFGSNSEFDTLNFSSFCTQYVYNSKKNTYDVVQDDMCSDSVGGSMSYVYQAILTKTATSDYIDIYEYYVYEDYASDLKSINYYSDYEKNNLIIKNSTDAHDIKYFVDNYTEMLGIYKYHFEMGDNTYVFKSVEKIK